MFGVKRGRDMCREAKGIKKMISFALPTKSNSATEIVYTLPCGERQKLKEKFS